MQVVSLDLTRFTTSSCLVIILGQPLTAIIAAPGANVSAKRVAAAHVTFNVLGTILCLILLGPFTAMIQWFQALPHLSPEMTIAFSHGAFNVSNTIVQFPFIGALAYFVTKLIPGEDEVVKYEALISTSNLSKQAPSIALGNAKRTSSPRELCSQSF